MTRLAFVGAAVAAAACSSDLPPEGNVRLYVDTDAPLPYADGAPAPDGTPGLFDRLRIELFAPGAHDPCASCVRDFDARTDLFSQGASITIRGNVDRARVRLYRSADLVEGALSPYTTLESTVSVPTPGASGRLEITVPLDTEWVGFPHGTPEKPIDPAQGPPSSPRVGTWSHAKRTDCSSPPKEGEVCVPGGAFFMGKLAMGVPDPQGLYGTRQRLVAVSPFFLDAEEVTVGALRAWIASSKTPVTRAVTQWGGPSASINGSGSCTFDRPEGDGVPVSCVFKTAALAYCKSRGQTLPSEAQFEYAAGALASRRNVWGEELPACNDAVWGRGDVIKRCPATPRAGALAPKEGSRGRDAVVLPTGTIHDLAGNLSELMLDIANREDDPCWTKSQSAFFVDPVCTTPSRDASLTPDLDVGRGGNWFVPATSLQAAFRTASPPVPSGSLGFRCARANK